MELTQFEILTIIAVSLLILTTILFAFLISFYLKLRKELHVHHANTYILSSQMRSDHDKLYVMSRDVKSVNDDLKSLSSSISSYIQASEKKNQEYIYPTPQLADMISVTIKEQIAVQSILIKDQRAPHADNLQKIVNIVCKTYPHVDPNYIASKVIFYVESM